ncbi:hypothetical protein Tsubulata_019400 [Turnera subulata]|uniref:F-box domain-containing protein n=1 Tax=Turnera subulata TaxID=218843 RepID=A0A9Q0GKA8_9ROSI|nr:hypothetical protein Tsubulata_019400 [Turnera subulata]
MADSGSMLLSTSSKKQKREKGSDDTAAMEMKHHKTRAPDSRLPVDQAKTNNMERQVISAAPNRSYLPPDTVEEILDLLPFNSIERFRSVFKSLLSLPAIKFNVPKLLYYPYITNFPPSNYAMISDYSTSCDSKWEMFVWNSFTSVCGKFPPTDYYAYGFGFLENIEEPWKGILAAYYMAKEGHGSLLEWCTSLETPGIILGRKA